MGLGLRASLAGAVLTVVACGSGFTSSTAGDGGSDASTADTGTPDAATDSGSADSSSGGTDSSMHEGGASDGPGPPIEGGPGPSYCAMHAGMFTFCEDFDSYTSLTQLYGQWPNFSTTGGTFSFVTGTNAFSPPNSLEALTTSTSGVRTLIIHPMPAAGGSLTKRRLEFDFYIDTVSGIGVASAAAVAAIVLGNDVSAGVVGVAFGNGLAASTPTFGAIYEGPLPDSGLPEFGSSNVPPPFPSTGQWDGRFAIEIDYGPATIGADGGSVPSACAQLYIGPTPQLSPCLSLPASLSHPGLASIALGVYSGGAQNTGTVGVTFDNVTYVAQ
jgi:hypothetical protein